MALKVFRLKGVVSDLLRGLTGGVGNLQRESIGNIRGKAASPGLFKAAPALMVALTLMTALAFTVGLAGCEGGESYSGPHSVTVTGLATKNGQSAQVILYSWDSDHKEWNTVAAGQGTIASGSLDVSLKTVEGSSITATDWTDTGSYTVGLRIPSSGDTLYYYTGGKDKVAFASASEYPKVSFSSASTTLKFADFR